MESFIAPCLPNYYWAGGVATTGNSVYREPAPWTMMMMMKKQAEREVFQVDDLFDFSHQQNDGNRDEDEDDWTGFTAFTDDEKRYNCSNDEAGLNNNKLEGGDVSLMVDEAEFKACMPAVDELEWLGNFMEDDNSSYYYHCFNFDADDADAQLRQGVVPTCTPPTTIKEKEKEKEKEEVEEISAAIHPCRKAKLDKASKARSKRSRGDSSSVKSPRTWSIGGGLVVHTEEESQASTTCSADLSSSSSSSSMGAVDSSPLPPPPPPAKKAKKGCPNETQRQAVTRRCSHCGVDKTPQWRAGPSGPKSLCNACGVRFKSGRLFPEYRPAASPTFMSHIHSNSHRQVLEIRKQKETSSFYCTTTTEEKKSTTQENSRTIELGEAPLSKITTEESGSFF